MHGVDVAVAGSGLPVTVFAHGLGGSSAETRPLAARTPGTRLLLTFRGHGTSAPMADGWMYDDLADDLLAVADDFGATGAVGLSLGAGALLRLLSRQPGRFERLAFVLPAALTETREDRATERLLQIADAIVATDEDQIVRLLMDDVPDSVRSRGGTRLLVRRRAKQLLTTTPARPRASDAPLDALAVLAAVKAPSLVIGQIGDALHPAGVSRRLAAALPHGDLLLLEPGGVFWTATRQVQDALADHLAAVPTEMP